MLSPLAAAPRTALACSGGTPAASALAAQVGSGALAAQDVQLGRQGREGTAFARLEVLPWPGLFCQRPGVLRAGQPRQPSLHVEVMTIDGHLSDARPVCQGGARVADHQQQFDRVQQPPVRSLAGVAEPRGVEQHVGSGLQVAGQPLQCRAGVQPVGQVRVGPVLAAT